VVGVVGPVVMQKRHVNGGRKLLLPVDGGERHGAGTAALAVGSTSSGWGESSRALMAGEGGVSDEAQVVPAS